MHRVSPDLRLATSTLLDGALLGGSAVLGELSCLHLGSHCEVHLRCVLLSQRRGYAGRYTLLFVSARVNLLLFTERDIPDVIRMERRVDWEGVLRKNGRELLFCWTRAWETQLRIGVSFHCQDSIGPFSHTYRVTVQAVSGQILTQKIFRATTDTFRRIPS